ncbi:MAG TPA: DoxX family membrane protein [Candidatus Paceibacterota bacterium]|jgi:uncharacterized membrane protein YphA (DoxX/SURF4 family)|nr:DoxX family membrane protein [Candidatus Paceibacterota bacterium]
MNIKNVSIGEWLLRASIAFAFLYPPFDGLTEPDAWIGYFPGFINALPVDAHLLLHGFEIIEVIIALWILSGWKIRIPAILAALMLAAIVVFNGVQFPILFRDVSIALAALALAFLPRTANA